MKSFLLSMLLILSIGTAQADYTFIVPQEPGAGTDLWARIVAREMEKKLGEKIIIQNIPGANDTPGFNKFHNSLRQDPKTIMVAHGGNAEGYLYQRVDYDYKYYDPIGLQNITIMVGKRRDADVYKQTIRFASAAGTNPDIIAMTLLVCGPQQTLKDYQVCYNQHFKYIPGMTGNERKLAYMRGESNAIRETPAYYIKDIVPLSSSEDWFNPGVLDLYTGQLKSDLNFSGVDFREIYKKRWGVAPSGELYNAWLLVKNYRDVLQKSLWVNHNNPNRDRLRQALQDTINDPVSRAAIEKETGHYDWFIGDDVKKAQITLDRLTTKHALKDLVWWISVVLNQEAVYKDNIAEKAK